MRFFVREFTVLILKPLSTALVFKCFQTDCNHGSCRRKKILIFGTSLRMISYRRQEYFNCSIEDWLLTTVGVPQGCLLSPIFFNIFLERIMADALEDHEGTVSIGGRTITNLRFADDIDGLAGEEEEMAKLVDCLNKAPTAYGMEISTKKMKLMTKTTVASTQRSK